MGFPNRAGGWRPRHDDPRHPYRCGGSGAGRRGRCRAVHVCQAAESPDRINLLSEQSTCCRKAAGALLCRFALREGKLAEVPESMLCKITKTKNDEFGRDF